ncbi:S8 family serine peptidase [Paenibacillus gansuensis]|uniref:S8 family serine peptidase n=1 Tax=Paenibacillus gansuensis TaxID=306542 RepID=A0ABW5P9H3_9BACL
MNGYKLRKMLSKGIVTVLALTLALPVNAADTPSGVQVLDPPAIQYQAPESSVPPVPKVDKELKKQFENEVYVSYLIKMKEQADPQTVSLQAQRKAKANRATPAAMKLSARNAVITTLRETASRTQSPIHNQLTKLKLGNKGVKDFKSYFIVNAMSVTSTKEVMEELAARSDILTIVPDRKRYLDKAIQTEPSSLNPNSIGTSSSEIEWNVKRVQAPEVWSKGIDGTGIVVANMDTGVDYTHPALKRKWRGYNARGEIENPELSWYDADNYNKLPIDTDGHGTHTMGTMVGSEDDGKNQIGVAPGAKWIALRLFDPYAYDSTILRGAQWLLAPMDKQGRLHPEMAPDIVNNSWSGGSDKDEWFRPMVEAWRAAGIFPVFSAGNTQYDGETGEAGSIANPANYPESFATGATDSNGQLADFSLRGPSPYGELKPEVSAPGVYIRSSVPKGYYEGGWSGTSMAAPHTAAIAALLLQANRSLTVEQLEEVLQNTATPRTDTEYPSSPNQGYGYGIVNALKAVNSVMEGAGKVSGTVMVKGTDTQVPVITHTPLVSIFKDVEAVLTANVRDNISVSSVQVFGRVSGTEPYIPFPMKRTYGDARDGNYTAVVPKSMIQLAGLEYYIQITDYGKNVIETPVYHVDVSNGITPGYVQDFETDLNGFTIQAKSGAPWAWGIPTAGPRTAYSGKKVLSTSLNKLYEPQTNTEIIMPPIDLTKSDEGGFITFKHWYDMETDFDFGGIWIASKETNYEYVQQFSLTGTGKAWTTKFLDVTRYAGQRIFLKFTFTSDFIHNKSGWFIDDLALRTRDQTVPSAPGGLKGTSNLYGNAQLTWDAAEDYDVYAYSVYRTTYGGSEPERLATVETKAYTDTSALINNTYVYSVSSIDYSGNESSKSDGVTMTVYGPDILFEDSFDGPDDNGWTHSGKEDLWQRVSPAYPGPSTAVSAPYAWASSPNRYYPSNADASLISPILDLTGRKEVALTFDQWYVIESYRDFGIVEITNNGGKTWAQLAKYNNNVIGYKWNSITYNLSKYAGQKVQVRYRLTSDEGGNYEGWYLDNFKVFSSHVVPSLKIPSVVSSEISSYRPTSAEVSSLEDETVQADADTSQQTAESVTFSTGDETANDPPQFLPVEAVITLRETGLATGADPITGAFSFTHSAGVYEVTAESYGYYPQTKQVTIAGNGVTTNLDFQLEAKPYGTIAGTVSDKLTGKAIAGATVMVREDARVSPVTTDDSSRFTLQALEGTYTLAVFADNYMIKNVPVTVLPDRDIAVDITLGSFAGIPGEIKYDDGSLNSGGTRFAKGGNAFALRITPPATGTLVTGASFLLRDDGEDPKPRRYEFQYALMDASGPNGSPGKMISGPFTGTGLPNKQLTTVTFPEPVSMASEFYIVYIQVGDSEDAPWLGTWYSKISERRSWDRNNNLWGLISGLNANSEYMIRANVLNPLDAPVITDPASPRVTNQSSVNVTLTSPVEGVTAHVYNGLNFAATGALVNGKLTIPVTLQPGLNQISAELSYDDLVSERSASVSINLDNAAPIINLVSPAEGTRTNQSTITVTGTTYDEHPGELKINGETIQTADGGKFSTQVHLKDGENRIAIQASDQAGNVTDLIRTVTLDTTKPVITNIEPAVDLYLARGQTLNVAFDSEPDVAASFSVAIPPSLLLSGMSSTWKLTEKTPGHYEGSFLIPNSLLVEGAAITVSAVDQAGNRTDTAALGKLYVRNLAPVAVIQASATTDSLKDNAFSASGSSDPDGTTLNYAWDFGDGTASSLVNVNKRFKRPGTYTVTLTVTDEDGAQSKATHVIIVKKPHPNRD